MAASVSHLTNELVLLPVPKHRSPFTFSSSATPRTATKETLRSLYLSLKPPLSPKTISDAIQFLQQHELSTCPRSSDAQLVDAEEISIYDALVRKMAAALYAHTLDVVLKEASDAETEAEWWSDIERSRFRAAHYLLQTLPSRVLSFILDIKHAVYAQHRETGLSVLSVYSIGQVLVHNGGLDNMFMISIFPHLRSHPYAKPFSFVSLRLQALSLRSTHRVLERWRSSIMELLSSIPACLVLPIDLARQECTLKRKALERIRDERAEVLGTLVLKRNDLFSALCDEEVKSSRLRFFIESMNQLIAGDRYSQLPTDAAPSRLLAITLHTALPAHTSWHQQQEHNLLRPGRLALLWPRLVLFPPLLTVALHWAFASSDTLLSFASDSIDTVRQICNGWIISPLKDIIKTVRAGGDHGVIVQKESIEADIKSLERMALALARDKLHYTRDQLAALSLRVHLGDLTPILEVYEEDIKSPVKSAVGGTLLRNLFIQIQKAKVDIDQTLAGIDKLLKSQELTFAFVGVAPALAIVYVAGGAIAGLWRGGKGKGRYGGKRRRTMAWLAIRRIERLLVSGPASAEHLAVNDSVIPPLTAGLLLLSVSTLRTYGESSLPLHSRLREGFLEDVSDLENPSLGREGKVRVIERMWRSWGDALGWGRAGNFTYTV